MLLKLFDVEIDLSPTIFYMTIGAIIVIIVYLVNGDFYDTIFKGE